MTNIEYLKIQIQNLFSRYFDRDPTENLRYVSEYFGYLADAIDYERFSINADKELVDSFESIYLWLQDELLYYPESIRNQVIEIVKNKELCEIFAIISNLSKEDLVKIWKRKKFKHNPILLLLLMFNRSFVLPPGDKEYITSTKLFDAKMGLRRLSQIVKFTSSQKLFDYDENFKDFKSNYDPNLINKNKIVTLINLLRVEAANIPDEENKKKLFEKLDNLESEVKRPKVRWAIVITGFFVIFGFLSDLKTLNPTMYERSLKIAESIISVLHQDGLVQKSQPALLIDQTGSSEYNDD